MAELKALLFGLSLVVEHGFQHVILESDSLSVITRLNSYQLGRAVLDLLCEDIHHLAAQLT